MIEFDEIDYWFPQLSSHLGSIVTPSILSQLKSEDIEYIEDALRRLVGWVDANELVDETIDWISSIEMLAFHGTRLTSIEANSIRQDGLQPLKAMDRFVRLERALRSHPRWQAVKGKLASEIERHGEGAAAGLREGQIHLSLSRSGLLEDYDHYLVYGSEFDQRVAHSLLGDSGVELLAQDGKPTLVLIRMPGNEVLSAAQWPTSVEDIRRRGDVPNVVREMLQLWAYKIIHADYQPTSIDGDCPITLTSPIPSSWVFDVECVELPTQV